MKFFEILSQKLGKKEDKTLIDFVEAKADKVLRIKTAVLQPKKMS